jgi:hypothetical protein
VKLADFDFHCVITFNHNRSGQLLRVGSDFEFCASEVFPMSAQSFPNQIQVDLTRFAGLPPVDDQVGHHATEIRTTPLRLNGRTLN